MANEKDTKTTMTTSGPDGSKAAERKLDTQGDPVREQALRRDTAALDKQEKNPADPGVTLTDRLAEDADKATAGRDPFQQRADQAGAAVVDAPFLDQDSRIPVAPKFDADHDPNQSSNVARPSARLQALKDGRVEEAAAANEEERAAARQARQEQDERNARVPRPATRPAPPLPADKK